MKKDIPKIINYFLLALGIIILFIFIRSLDLQEVVTSFKLAGFRVIFIVLLLTMITILIRAFRWQFLIKKITGDHISLKFSFLSILAGVSSGSIFPGRNEITKPLMLKSAYNARLSKTVPAALIEKVLDFVTLILLFLLTLVFIQDTTAEFNKYIIPFSLIAIALLLSIFIFPKKMHKFSDFIINRLPLSNELKTRLEGSGNNFFKSFNVLKEKRISFAFFLLSFAGMLLEMVRFYYLFLALGIGISAITVFVAFTGSFLLGILALIPGGIGVTEFSAAAIMKALSNIDFAEIKTVVLIDRLVSYYFFIGVGALVLLFQQKLIKSPKP